MSASRSARVVQWLVFSAAIAGISTCAGQVEAQMPHGTHAVSAEPPASRTIASVPPDSLAAFCAMSYRVDADAKEVTLVALRPAPVATNPECVGNEAAVLVRPGCVFNLLEFVQLRVRAPYVVLMCRPNGALQAVGIPLGAQGPQPGQRATTTTT
jgi:hypothetical protein